MMKRELILKLMLAIVFPGHGSALQADEPPLEIVVLQDHGRVDIGKPFKVEFVNRSDQAIRIYDPRSAEGFRALSLVFTHGKTKQQRLEHHDRGSRAFDPIKVKILETESVELPIGHHSVLQ